VKVTQAAPYHLLADVTDASPLRIRRTRSGDAWERAEAESCAVGDEAGSGNVSLGLPGIRTSLLG
jgi:tRNA-2-methylthio-N6-dimethylallyladenosine synthase